MSTVTADRKTEADLARSLELLSAAYARAGKVGELRLFTEDSARRGRYHYRLTFNGYTVTDWVATAPADLWVALLDMRRAVEVLDLP